MEQPGATVGSAVDRDAAETVAYAEELGAEVVRVSGASLAAAIVDVCRRRRVTHVVLPYQGPRGIAARLRPTLADQVLASLPDVEVHLVAAVPSGRPAPHSTRP